MACSHGLPDCTAHEGVGAAVCVTAERAVPVKLKGREQDLPETQARIHTERTSERVISAAGSAARHADASTLRQLRSWAQSAIARSL